MRSSAWVLSWSSSFLLTTIPARWDEHPCLTARGRTMRSLEPTVASEGVTQGTHDTITKHTAIITVLSHFSDGCWSKGTQNHGCPLEPGRAGSPPGQHLQKRR